MGKSIALLAIGVTGLLFLLRGVLEPSLDTFSSAAIWFITFLWICPGLVATLIVQVDKGGPRILAYVFFLASFIITALATPKAIPGGSLVPPDVACLIEIGLGLAFLSFPIAQSVVTPVISMRARRQRTEGKIVEREQVAREQAARAQAERQRAESQRRENERVERERVARERAERERASYQSHQTPNSADDPFAILGVSRDATRSQVKDAFRRLSAEWHPDKFTKYQDPRVAELAHENYIKINAAYEEIKHRKGWT